MRLGRDSRKRSGDLLCHTNVAEGLLTVMTVYWGPPSFEDVTVLGEGFVSHMYMSGCLRHTKVASEVYVLLK